MLRDPVSELPGRADFQAALRREVAALDERDQPLALVLTNPDDFTVVFKMSEPSTVVERYVIRNEAIVDTATYGEWSDKVQALVDEGFDNESDEWNALQQEFNNSALKS